jgi:hypothetical protein
MIAKNFPELTHNINFVDKLEGKRKIEKTFSQFPAEQT